MCEVQRVVFLLVCLFTGPNIAFPDKNITPQRAENDLIFEKFLHLQMKNFGNWIKEKKMDPFPWTSDLINIHSTSSAKVTLDCVIRNQCMSNHSLGRLYDLTEVKSDFENHAFEVTREIRQGFLIFVNFSCTGNVNADQYPGDALGKDISFSGRGVLTFHVQEAVEIFQVSNFGIAEDYKLDFTEAYYYYVLAPTWYEATINATWNDTRVQNDTFGKDVSHEIGSMYRRFLRYDHGQNHQSPSQQLLKTYLIDITKNLDLNELLADFDVPEPYAATPTPLPTDPTDDSMLERTTKASKLSLFAQLIRSKTSNAGRDFASPGFVQLTIAIYLIWYPIVTSTVL